MKHSDNHIGRITIFFIIVAATLGIAMAGGLVRWQGIADLFKGDSPEKTAKVEATAKPSHNATYAHTTAFSGMPFMLSVEGCSVTGEAGSMDATSEIEIAAIDSVPPLAAGMVNVTRGHAGYRLSPAGLRFARPVSVELGYDSLLLPKGHSTREIRTFLYNSEKRHWEALPRDSVMEGSQNIVSQSRQAGEMINAIVQLPELPESEAFTPTMLTELEAAHPATGITMMEPPAANSQGTANLSYPITVPAGRNGLQPDLSVSYSSEAGNGLLGMGWDMQLPAITVDSKWGVPRYDGDYETECYSYNGQELLPSPHYLTQWESRNTTGNKQFRPRTEGSFDSIVRCGNGPTEYYWIVWDKGGTKYYYGTYDGNTAAASVLLKDGAGNIGHWPLCRVEDLDGNFMTYHYSIREQYDGDMHLGKQLWPDSIIYTGHKDGETEERGKYKVLLSSGFNPWYMHMQALELNQSDPDGQTNGIDSIHQYFGAGCDIRIRVHKRDRKTGVLLSGAVFELNNGANSLLLTTNGQGAAVWDLETPGEYDLSLKEITPPSGWCTRMGEINFHVVGMSNNSCHLDVVANDVRVDSVIYENAAETQVRIVVTNDICGNEAYPCISSCDCDSVWDDLEKEYPYDLRTDARLGFLRSGKEKLRRIVVMYKDSVVRSYSFCYGKDIFGRAQLRSIRQYGADCDEESYTHTFGYYRDVDSVRLEPTAHDVANAERGDYNANASFFSKAARVVALATRDLVSAETAIGGSVSLSGGGGGGVDLGLGFNVCSKDASIGYSYNYSASGGKGLATLADINGDGLPDRVYLRASQVCYKPQVAGSNAFGTERRLGFSSFLSDNSTTTHHGPAVNIADVAHGGLGWSSTTSRTSVYFADVNGDGLTDLVKNGGAGSIQPAYAAPVFSVTESCGLPKVTAGGCSHASISLTGVPPVELAGNPDTLSYDLVRVWQAGSSGWYAIHAPVKALKDTQPGVNPTLDTFTVSVEFYGKLFSTDAASRHFLIASKRLAPGDSAWNGNLLTFTNDLSADVRRFFDGSSIRIQEGWLFFRVRSKGGRPVSHAVRWDPQVTLNGAPTSSKKASECQLLEGSGKLHCPFDGVLRLRDTLHPQGMPGTVQYRLLRNNADFRGYPYVYSSPGLGFTVYSDDTLHVRRGDSLEFVVEANTGDNLVENQWHPHLYYEAVTDSNTNGEVDNVSMIIPGTPDNPTDTVLLMELFPVPRYDFPAHSLHPLFGGMYGNWGQFQHLHDERDTLDMVAVNSFVVSVSAFNQAALNRYAFLKDTNFLKRVSASGNTQAADTLAAIRSFFKCLPLWANGETRRHEGICPNSHISGQKVCLGNYVTPELSADREDSLFSIPGTYPGTGLKSGSAAGAAPSSPASAMLFSDLDKITETNSNSYTCGIWKFGGSYSDGVSKTTHDFMDLNGDGCPDFIRPGGKVYYSLPRLSSWETAFRQVLPADGFHLSNNRTAGGNFTAQAAHTVKESKNSGKGPNIIINRSVSHTLKAGVNANFTRDSVEHTLMDINGDGLPDMLYSSGRIALNLGYGFAPQQYWDGIGHIGIYYSEAGGADVSTGSGSNREVWEEVVENQDNADLVEGNGVRVIRQKSAWRASISGGVSYTLSLNQHQVTLADINGDGLPDLVYRSSKDTAIAGLCGRLLGGHIWYRLNTGNGFDAKWKRWTSDGGNLIWGLSVTTGANIDGTGGATYSWVKVSGSGNGNASLTTSGDRIQITDFDGDGLPDLLRSEGGNDMTVRYAKFGRTGLLKSVTYPLGGSVTMDYEMTSADVHHSRRWVMTKVVTHDSLPGDGCDSLRTSIRYDHGYYDRTERDFLGFAVVVSEPLDENGSALRSVIRYYDNRSVHAKGSLLCDALVNIRKVNNITDTAKYLVTTCSYATDSVGDRMGGTRAVFHRLTRRQTCFYEGLPQAQITAWEEFDYENTHGNVVRQRQGSTDQTTVEANISYHAQYNNNHCVNRVSSVEITGYRKRMTEVDSKGHYTAFMDWYDNTHYLTTRLQYDQYGNVITMRSPNTTVHYTYDNFVHSYPTAITDTFGVTSQMQDYDFRFGVPLTMVDQAGSQMLYTIDGWGRIITIRGPKEIAAGKPFTIRHTYTGREPAPSGSTHQRAVSMAMTEHYDPQHPSNPIKTYTYCDGLGRIVQTRKEAEIGGVEKLVVSGHTVVDALGRTVASHYPTEIHRDSTRFRFIVDGTTPSTATYDVLDRPLVQTAPDGSTTTMQYGFNGDHLNKMLFSTTTTDANSNVSTELKDVEGKPWAVHPSGQQPVYFEYNPVGDNTKVYSSLPNDWERTYSYDMLGRRLTYTECELAESYTYNGGQISSHSQNWMENGNTQSKTTTYHYNAHRLDSVSYEDALTTIYHYDQYGRVDSLYDESGVMCYEYGNMGEVTQETRIYALPFLSQPIALTTQFEYDSWGRILNITYPDNEVVNYAYDLGGQLQSITNNSSYTYLDNVSYDRFGAKEHQEYGNGMVTDYEYNIVRRLSRIDVTSPANGGYSDINYTYDPVGNVTQVMSYYYWTQGQGFTEAFTYDASDQLVSASETQNQNYQLSVLYGDWGKINSYALTQTDYFNGTTTQCSRSFTYPSDPNSPQESQSLFAPESYQDQQAQEDVCFTFGINGSLRKRVVQAQPQASNTEYYLFNSAANLKAYSNNGLDFAYYGYNASNTRTYKLSMLNMHQWANGQPEPLSLQPQSAMFYPNAYINFNQNGEYTKHYYNGSERIASRLGDNTIRISANGNARLATRSMQVDEHFRNDILTSVYAEDNPIEYSDVNIQTASLQHTGNATDIFYYHMNHLGSTAFVTDQNRNVTQGFLYAPFGEITTEYNATFGNDIIPKYSFNAKELDEETGMYYYEARYYKPPVFTSRNPMMDQKPWLNPYHYCSNNPIGRVDPSGMLDDDYFNENGKYLGSDNATSDNVRIISQINWDKLKSIDADGKESIDHEIGNTISFSFSEASNSGMPEEAQLNVYQHYNPTKGTLKVHPDDNQKIMGMTTVVASNNKIIAIQIRLKGNSSGIKIADHANEIRCFFSHEEAHVKMFYKLKYKEYTKTPVEEREEYAIRAEMNSEYWNKVRQEYRNATLQYAKKFGIIF